MACEGTRAAGATVPSCGAGPLLARAGKAPAANTALSGLAGAAGSCAAHPGKPAHTTATSKGVFMVTSIDHPF